MSARLYTAVVVALVISGSPAAAGDPVADFYRGHTVSLYIGNTAGGGYDLYGRFLARYLGRYIPGSPNIVSVNMPGAGGLNMAGWLYSRAQRDGTAIALASQVLAIEQALGSPGVQYDSRKFAWLGRVAPVVEISYTWHTSATKTLDDARRRETVMGGISPTSNTVTYLRLLNALAGTRFKIISGYPGTTEMHLAMERGETEGATKTWEAFKADNGDWLPFGKVNLLVQYALSGSPELPGVPLMMDLGHSDGARAVLRFFATGNELGRSLIAPPGVPPERIAALRRALIETTRDPEFLAEARQRRIDIGPLPGEALQWLIDATLDAPADVIAAAKKAREG